MKRIYKLSSIMIVSVMFMAVKCGEEEIPQPDIITTEHNISIEEALADSTKYLDIAIAIDSVFFTDPEGTLFNGTGSNANGTRVIADCNGNSLDVFTSTDREFSFQSIPTGMGTIKGILSEYNGARQLLLRSIDDAADLINDKCDEKKTIITVDQFNSGAYEGQLVMIEDAQFVLDDSNYGNGKFNGTESNGNGNKTLTDCDGNELIVFTYTSDAWSNEFVPTERGNIVGVASSYNTTKQLLIRSMDDVADMIDERCIVGGPSNPECYATPSVVHLQKDFSDSSLTSGGWSSYDVVGSHSWSVGSLDGNHYATCTNRPFLGNAESWLISPSVDLSSASNHMVSFINIANQTGDKLKLMISTDYSGSGDPSAASWTDLSSSVTWDEDAIGWDQVCSGNVDISSYNSTDTYIAFVYTGSGSDGSVWQVDYILIKE